MGAKLANPGSKSVNRFSDDGNFDEGVVIGRKKHIQNDEAISISLKYYRFETECFSEWNRNDLKQFTSTINKLRGMTVSTVHGHSICSQHKRKPQFARYSRPAGLGEELPMSEIRVDPHNLARVHGVFMGSVFHLVWLDRKHQVFPYHK